MATTNNIQDLFKTYIGNSKDNNPHDEGQRKFEKKHITDKKVLFDPKLGSKNDQFQADKVKVIDREGTHHGYNTSKDQNVYAEETYVVYEAADFETEEDLLEAAGTMKGLPKAMIKSVVSSGGGEHSDVQSLGASSLHSFKAGLNKSMKNGVAVVHINGKPVAATHVSDDYGRTKYGVVKPEGSMSLTRARQKGGTGKWVGGARGSYVPASYDLYQDTHHSKDEAVGRVMGAIEKHTGGDINDKSTFKNHKIEIKTYGRDTKRMAKQQERKSNKPAMQTNYVSYSHQEKPYNPYGDKKAVSKTPAGSMEKVKSAALDKLADKRVVDNSSPHSRATELHAALTRYRYKKEVADLRRRSYGKEYSRKAIDSMKERGEVKEEVELSEAPRGASPIAGTRLISKHEGKDGYHTEHRYRPDWEQHEVHHYHNGKHLGEGPVSYFDKDEKKDAAEHAKTAAENFRVVNGKVYTNEANTKAKLTKEDVINSVVARYTPDSYTPLTTEEKFARAVEGINEGFALALVGLYENLNNDNKEEMVSQMSTKEGINKLIDFAISGGGQ